MIWMKLDEKETAAENAAEKEFQVGLEATGAEEGEGFLQRSLERKKALYGMMKLEGRLDGEGEVGEKESGEAGVEEAKEVGKG